jgi:putative ABC transport system ATP-binding protein
MTAVITHNATIAGMAERVVTMRSGEVVQVKLNIQKLATAALEE